MKAVILAAGRGSRMGALTVDRPKCLTVVFGETLLARQLKSIKEAGIHEVCIVRGYKYEMVSPPNVKLMFNPKWETTNMVSTLLIANNWIGSDNVIIAYSDIIYTANTISNLSKTADDIVVANNLNWLSNWKSRFSNPLDDLETFKKDSQGLLLEIGQKTINISEIDGQFMGLVKFSKAGWNIFYKLISALDPKTIDSLDMTKALNLCISNGENINTIDIGDDWFEFDSESDISIFEGLKRG